MTRVARCAQVMEANAGKAALSDKERKLILVIQKQDRLLYLCLYLLLNLAEDTAVERKMRKRAVVPHLLHMLEARQRGAAHSRGHVPEEALHLPGECGADEQGAALLCAKVVATAHLVAALR